MTRVRTCPRRTFQLKVLLAGWERTKLRQIARLRGVSVSDVVRTLIRGVDSVGHGAGSYEAALRGMDPATKDALLNGNWYSPRPRPRQS